MFQPILARRTLIRDFLIVSAGMALLPACLQNEGQASIALKNIQLTAADEALLAALCETLIPATRTPGARDLGLHLFTMKMIDDCYLKKDQQKILRGLKAFEDKARKTSDRPFTQCTPEQRAGLLQAIEQRKAKDDDEVTFYTTVKKLTIQGFTSCQYYLTRVHTYELVPGRFHGCVPLSSSANNQTI